MKKNLFLLMCSASLAFLLDASPKIIAIVDRNHQHDHNEYYDPADKPEVYYDADYQQIAIYADGFASYYDVDIVSMSTLQIELTTQVSGFGDTFDISSLPCDNYRIVITSSYNNVYEGLFSNY